jgi:hypothetical protein
MSDQVRAGERPEDEMAFERYRLPTLIGQGGMGKVVAAAAAAMALALFSVLATAPGVARAAPWSPPPPRTIPVVAAQELTPPWWPFVLQYGVLVIAVCSVAWMLHRFAKMWSAPLTTSGPWPVRRALGRGGIAGVLRARKRMALVEAGHRCAIPTCRHPTTEIAHIVPESQTHDDSFENLIALCPKCQNKEIDAQTIRMYKRNLEILNSRYSDFERRVFDQIAETDRRSFIVEAGLEISLLHAVNDGLLKRVELAPVAIQRAEPTQYTYEVTDEGLAFINRYVCGEDIS